MRIRGAEQPQMLPYGALGDHRSDQLVGTKEPELATPSLNGYRSRLCYSQLPLGHLRCCSRLCLAEVGHELAVN